MFGIFKDKFKDIFHTNEEILPWITYGAIDWLKNYLKKDMYVFEWGSGDSTKFFAQHVKCVITIDHSQYWFKKLVTELDKKLKRKTSIHLLEPTKVSAVDVWYQSNDGKYVGKDFSGYSFEKYVRFIDNFPDDFFDLVVVDGRARPGCLKHAMPKIKTGGYLLLDNSERIEYKNALILLNQWVSTGFMGHGPHTDVRWETRIWQKTK
jgi:hypothetical protein